MLSFLVLGDLHFDPTHLDDFDFATQQLKNVQHDFIFQLGDVGGYHYPGSKDSFVDAKQVFEKFKHPVYTLMGNHDLEGEEFDSDEENQKAWMEVFQQKKLWRSIEIGESLGILLSTTQFRKQPICSQQVSLGDEQYNWLKNTLSKNKNRLTFIFCHVPIISSGLTTLLTPHLSAPNAFLDQTNDPFKYDDLLKNNPQVRLWFSGHNHLGHQYRGSISQRHQCTFIHTGTMSSFSRDGLRQSRHIISHRDRIEIRTVDHKLGNDYLDAELNLANLKLTHHQHLHPQSLGKHKFTPAFNPDITSWSIDNSLFQWHHDHLIEYDKTTTWPLGVVYRGEELSTRCDDKALYLKSNTGERRFIKAPHQRFFRPFIPSQPYIRSGSPLAIQ